MQNGGKRNRHEKDNRQEEWERRLKTRKKWFPVEITTGFSDCVKF
jgi:hypothetical protein